MPPLLKAFYKNLLPGKEEKKVQNRCVILLIISDKIFSVAIGSIMRKILLLKVSSTYYIAAAVAAALKHVAYVRFIL